MKIKEDFVTNSSSQSHIVFLPREFDLGLGLSIREMVSGEFERVKAILIDVQSCDDFYMCEDWINDTTESFFPEDEQFSDSSFEDKDLKLQSLWNDAFEKALEILQELGLYLQFIPEGPDGSKIIYNIGYLHYPKIKEAVEKIEKERKKCPKPVPLLMNNRK